MKLEAIVELDGGLVNTITVFESVFDAQACWYKYWGTKDDREIDKLREGDDDRYIVWESATFVRKGEYSG